MKRRMFLQGFGGAALAAPYLSSMLGRNSWAQEAGPIVRNILFFTHNGVNTTQWFPQIENGAITAADLSPTLQPLGEIVDQILIPRGFRSLNGFGAGQSLDPHNQAMGSKLTCAPINDNRQSDNYAKGKSVDHEMASQMNPEKQPPLLLSVGQSSTSIKEVISFSASETPHISEVNPFVVYSQLTQLLSAATPGAMPTTPGAMTPGDYRLLAGQKSMDLVRDDLMRLQGMNMSQSDKERVTAWLGLLEETEGGMISMGNNMANAACTRTYAGDMGVGDETIAAAGTGAKGTKSGSFNFTIPSANDETMKQSFTVGGDMMLNLIALSAICDHNRVLGMVYPGYVIFNWDEISHQFDHHAISHRSGDLAVNNQCIDGVMQMITDVDNWYAGKYAKLCKLLKAIPEGDTNILHNSATMWLNELSDGDAHNLNDLPIVIAGSAGGKLKQGWAVNVEGNNIGPGKSETGCTETQNTSGVTSTGGGRVPINKLYCTLMNAYGMTDAGAPWEKWGMGDTDKMDGTFQSPGEVPELLA